MTTQHNWRVTVEQQQIQEINETLRVINQTNKVLVAIVDAMNKRIAELERKQQ